MLRCFSPLRAGENFAAGHRDCVRIRSWVSVPFARGRTSLQMERPSLLLLPFCFSPLRAGENFAAFGRAGPADSQPSRFSPLRAGENFAAWTLGSCRAGITRFQSPSRGGELRCTSRTRRYPKSPVVSVPFARGRTSLRQLTEVLPLRIRGFQSPSRGGELRCAAGKV